MSQASHTPGAAPPKPGSLLVACGDPAHRTALVHMLEAAGHAVSVAESRGPSLELLRSGKFDLALVDVRLTDGGLEQALEQLRAEGRLSQTLIVAISAAGEGESVARCLDLGATDSLIGLPDPALLGARLRVWLELKRWREAARLAEQRLEREQRRSDELLQIVIPLGIALSNETDFNQMLEKILIQAQTLGRADAGTLYLRTDDDRLKFVIVRNTSLDLALGGTTGAEIPFAPLLLHDAHTGRPNHHNVATHAALTGETVNIPDAYQAEGFDFSGTQAIDRDTGYRSTSFLTLPLKDGRQAVIGVLQLINALDEKTGRVVPFDLALHPVIESLASLAAVALQAYIREQRLRQQIEELRIEIDEGKRARRVAEITETEYFRRLQEKAREMRSAHAGARPVEPRDG